MNLDGSQSPPSYFASSGRRWASFGHRNARMGVLPRVATAFTVAALALVTPTERAQAFEPGAHPPYLAGATGGVPIGVLPPPAFYISSLTTYFNGVLHTDNSPKPAPTISVFSEGLAILWVPDAKLWGARYGAFVNQIVAVETITNLPPGRKTGSDTGLLNTVISPLNLAWTLPSDFYVSVRFAFYPPNGQYDRHSLVNVANNFWSFEPSVGLSYLKGGFDFSLHLVYDIETENKSSSAPGNVHSRYLSGHVFTADYSASQAFGQCRVGVTGHGVQQTTNDSAGGRTLRDTQLSNFAIGPLIEYNARWIGVNAYYIREVMWKRTFGGDTFYLRATVRY
jgi:hypothetical protein